MRRLTKLMTLVVVALVASLAMAGAAWAAPQVVHGTNSADNEGSITIQNATVDKKYSLYKLFDATLASQTSATGDPIINYTVPAGKTLPADNAWFAVDANGNVSVKEGADITTDAFKTWAKSFGTPVAQNTVATDSSLTFDQLEYGYYFVESEVGPVLTIDSTTPSATVIDKNQTSKFEKYIQGANGAKLDINEVTLKEDVPFAIEVSATNYDKADKIFKYQINDVLENGMTFKAAPTVKVDGTPVTEGVTVTYKDKAGAATTDLSKAQSFSLEINWTQDGTKATDHLYPANATILVEYNGFLDPDKKDDIVVGGTTGNKNEAEVKYYKGNDNPTDKNPSGNLGKDQTVTFTTELAISKVDQDNNALQGAEFTLTGPNGTVVITTADKFTKDASGTYWLLKDGTYTTDDPNQEGMNKDAYASLTDKYKKETETIVQGAGQTASAIKATVGADGKATFTGLQAGDYTLSETKVPDGYNKIADITFTIGFTYDQNEESGEISNIKYTSSNNDIKVGADNKLTTTIKNQKGTELPSTGGMGTTILYIIGAVLVIGAGVFLVTKRRVRKGEGMED